MQLTESEHLSDPLVRQLVLDRTKSFAVSAPAGSGKTELLTQRFLSLLSGTNEPEEILAITFTRKAVSEMRERIMEALRLARSTPESESKELPEHRQTTWRLARDALELDDLRGWRLLSNPARLRVMTFDALCTQLVRQLPISSGAGGVAALSEEPERFYELAVDALFERLNDGVEPADDLRKLLALVDYKAEQLKSLLVSVLANREQWRVVFEKLDARPVDLAEQLGDTWHQYAEQKISRLALLLAPFSQSAAELLQFASENLLATGINTGTDWDFGKGLPPPLVSNLGAWKAVARFFITRDGNYRKLVNVKQGFPPKSQNPQHTPEEFKRLREQLEETTDELRQMLHELQTFPDLTSSEDSESVQLSVLNVVRYAMALLEVEFRQHQQADFVANSLAALQAIQYDDGIAQQLDQRINHLLIDEFQDTSQLQFDLVNLLCKGWSDNLGDQKSLFVVGDAMQSIYAFRNARVGLFMRAREQGFSGQALQAVNLTRNFRSSRPLVTWVNHCFSRIFPQDSDWRSNRAAHIRSESVLDDVEHSEVVCFNCIVDQEQRWAETSDICQKIVALKNTAPEQTVGVLVRNRAQAQELLQAFQQWGIPWLAHEFDLLTNKPVVFDMLLVVHFCLSPAEQQSWYGLLRSPMLGLSNADCWRISQNDQQDLSSRLEVALNDPGFSEESRLRISLLQSALNQHQKTAGRASLHDNALEFWRRLGGHWVYNSADEQRLQTRFFLQLCQLSSHGESLNWERVKRHFMRSYVPVQPSDEFSVEVLTIHKSKGLEFDTVFLPALEKAPRSAEKELMIWQELYHDDGSTNLLIGLNDAAGSHHKDCYEYLRYQARQQQIQETARLLYVACTRARYRLYLYRGIESAVDPDTQDSPANSFAQLLWPQLPEPAVLLDSAHADGDRQNNEPATQGRLSRQAIEQLASPQRSVGVATTKLGRMPSAPRKQAMIDAQLARAVGVVAHQYLAFGVPTGQASDYPPEHALMTQLKQAGLRNNLAAGVEWLRRVFYSLERDVDNQWIFAATHTECQREVSYSYQDEGVKRTIVIDRTFVDTQGNRWIVDFKIHLKECMEPEALQSLAETHRPQLQRYREVLGGSARIAVYFVLQQTLLEL